MTELVVAESRASLIYAGASAGSLVFGDRDGPVLAIAAAAPAALAVATTIPTLIAAAEQGPEGVPGPPGAQGQQGPAGAATLDPGFILDGGNF